MPEIPAKCTHYWLIEPANGPVSLGECQRCGGTKEFKNYVDVGTWGEPSERKAKLQDVQPARLEDLKTKEQDEEQEDGE